MGSFIKYGRSGKPSLQCSSCSKSSSISRSCAAFIAAEIAVVAFVIDTIVAVAIVMVTVTATSATATACATAAAATETPIATCRSDEVKCT